MKSFFLKLWTAFFFSLLGASVASSNSLPTGGEWQSDRASRSQWLDQRGLDSLESVNFILCFVNGFWAPSQVNKGPYRAQVNEASCEGNTDSSTGAKLLDVIAELSTTADGKTEAKLWIPEDNWDDVAEPVATYVRVVATESPSESNPNGIFEVIWNDIGKTTQRIISKGNMSSTTSGVSVHTEESPVANQVRAQKLIISGNTRSGSGAVSSTDSSGTLSEELGFNASASCLRTVGGSTVCYNRSLSAVGAKKSSWRYGVYDAQGKRLDLPNPSFNIRNQDNGEWGSGNRWGVWTNSVWQNGAAVRQVSGVDVGRTFTYVRYPGRLTESTSNYHKVVTPTSTPITLTCNWGCVTTATIQAWEAGSINDPKATNSSTTYIYENGVLYLASDSTNKTPLVTSKNPGFGMSLLSSNNTSYYYESGPRNWQSFSGLRDASQSLVTFSDPIDFLLPSKNQTLSFEGHGTINGIPSTVYLRSNDALVDTSINNWFETTCQNNNCKWIQDYLIDDESVTINGQTYFIQWLQANITPARLSGATPSDIVFGSVSNLPSGELPTNVRQLIGEVPSLSADSPIRVIQGVMTP